MTNCDRDWEIERDSKRSRESVRSQERHWESVWKRTRGWESDRLEERMRDRER